MLYLSVFPLRLKKEKLTEEEFLAFCELNRDIAIERDSSGNILVMSPTSSYTSEANGSIFAEVYLWNKKHKQGKVFDSSGGFILPNSAMRSPDVSFILNESFNKLSKEDKKGFYKLCPDFIIELKSPSDDLKMLQSKMQEYIQNGCSLAWLIDMEKQNVFVYDKEGNIEIHNNFSAALKGKFFMNTFEIILSEILP
jgi:Uma2 family endonuclease